MEFYFNSVYWSPQDITFRPFLASPFSGNRLLLLVLWVPINTIETNTNQQIITTKRGDNRWIFTREEAVSMARVKAENASTSSQQSRTAMSPESVENRLIAKTMKLAEKQIDEGTASSQVMAHFLKLATVKNQLELEKIRQENKLTQAKIEMMESAKKTEELYRDALQAMRSYSGFGSSDDED